MDAPPMLGSLRTILGIPQEIYGPLVQIAQLHYDAGDINRWYLALQRHLPNIDTDVNYNVLTPSSHASPRPQSTKTTRYLKEETPGCDSHTQFNFSAGSSDINSGIWSNDFALEPLVDPSLQFDPLVPPSMTYNSASSATASSQSLNSWMPTTPAPEFTTGSMLSKAPHRGGAIVATQEHTTPWLRTNTFNMTNASTDAREASYSPPYQIAVSNTAMPLLVPHDNPTSLDRPLNSETIKNTLFGSWPSTSSFYYSPYAPPISIVPSRKRRRIGKKPAKNAPEAKRDHRKSL